ncbi:MAG: hypothetical protein ACP5EQ_04230 [Candidatus Cloacimonadia bacterium]
MEKYKYSQWNVGHPIKEKVALLNTLTAAGIIIEKEHFEKIRKGMLDHLDAGLLKRLIENGFVVYREKEENEDATFWRLHHNIK